MSKKRSIRHFLAGVFDVLFVMILCFATLFATMYIKGFSAVSAFFNGNSKYSFQLITFLLAAVGVSIYIFYLIRHSNKELKNMVDKLYQEEPNNK